MTDTVSVEKRSKIMSKIKSKDTKPEMMIRSGLHKLGYRYKLHDKKLPGKPDLYLPKYNTVIEVMGCFWHGHDCQFHRTPKSNKEFWINKFEKNKERDESNKSDILQMGLNLLLVWECSINGKDAWNFEELIDEIQKFILNDDDRFLEITNTSEYQ